MTGSFPVSVSVPAPGTSPNRGFVPAPGRRWCAFGVWPARLRDHRGVLALPCFAEPGGSLPKATCRSRPSSLSLSSLAGGCPSGPAARPSRRAGPSTTTGSRRPSPRWRPAGTSLACLPGEGDAAVLAGVAAPRPRRAGQPESDQLCQGVVDRLDRVGAGGEQLRAGQHGAGWAGAGQHVGALGCKRQAQVPQHQAELAVPTAWDGHPPRAVELALFAFEGEPGGLLGGELVQQPGDVGAGVGDEQRVRVVQAVGDVAEVGGADDPPGPQVAPRPWGRGAGPCGDLDGPLHDRLGGAGLLAGGTGRVLAGARLVPGHGRGSWPAWPAWRASSAA